MLIATLPTLTGPESQNLSEEILRHPLIGAARYNTGGDSPYAPEQILAILKTIADRYGKIFYVDLEGRQMRVARWSPFSRGVAILNRDFTIELPGRIHFRRAGWCDIMNASPEERKIFFKPRGTKEEYYLGESQSVNVVAKKFEVKDYLGGLDCEYIKAAINLGITHFMLSFVEGLKDVSEFYEAYYANHLVCKFPLPKLVLKIESIKGIEFVQRLSTPYFQHFKGQLMAARDDLFLSFVEKRGEFLGALKIIVETNPEAIVASRILTGLLGYPQELTVGDMADIALMSQLGYKHFMLPDELAECFGEAMRNWQNVILPILEKDWFSEKKKCVKKKR